MSFGYSKYSFQPLNDYSSEYLYGRNKTPNLQKTTFKENKDYVESLINTRLNRLNQDKRNYYNNNYNYSLNLPSQNQQTSNLAKRGFDIMNSRSFEPIHVPVEIPGNAIPITNVPRYEFGGPVFEKTKGLKQKIQNKKITDILLALNFLGYIPKPTKPIQTFEDPEPDVVIPPKERVPTPPPVIVIKKKKKKVKKMKKPFSKRNWWRLLKDFINLYIFFSTGRKYSTLYAKERNLLIESRTKNLVQEIALIKDWLISIEEPFWNEFRVFEDLDLSFSNKDSQNKIKSQSLKIIVIIKKFMENLISKTTRLSDIPDRIQEIIYEYIRERGFFPKSYLTTFQTNRIDFEFFGGTRNVNSTRAGMILAYLLICGVLVQQILLHMKEVFKEFKKNNKVEISGKYVGSIIHYLTRDTFISSPHVVKSCLGLFNYYRNYHIYSAQIEKQEDSFRGMLTLEGTENDDEYAEFLIPEETITQFWHLNSAFVETYSKFIFSWAKKLAKIIKLKYSKNDRNLLPRRRLSRPPIKTIKRRESSDEEDKKEIKKKEITNKKGKDDKKLENKIEDENNDEEEEEEEEEED